MLPTFTISSGMILNTPEGQVIIGLASFVHVTILELVANPTWKDRPSSLCACAPVVVAVMLIAAPPAVAASLKVSVAASRT